MKVKVNSEWKTLSSTNVSDLLNEIGQVNTDGIAVAVNETVVPKGMWSTFTIEENFEIIIITATAGG